MTARAHASQPQAAHLRLWTGRRFHGSCQILCLLSQWPREGLEHLLPAAMLRLKTAHVSDLCVPCPSARSLAESDGCAGSPESLGWVVRLLPGVRGNGAVRAALASCGTHSRLAGELSHFQKSFALCAVRAL